MQPERDGTAAIEFDLLIAGGGLVGASLAVALAGQPLRIGVVEAVVPGAPGQPSFDDRSLALSRTSQRILATLGAWHGVADAASVIRRIHVSEQGRFGTAVIDARQQRVEALGYMIESRRLGAALWSRLNATGDCEVLAPARVEAVDGTDDRIRCTIRNGQQTRVVSTRLLVIADGGRSTLREMTGIGADRRAYGQVAIIGNVMVSAPGTGDTAFERFMPAGPLAMLPAGGNRYAFVLARPTSRADEMLGMPDDEFLQYLQAALGWRLGRMERLGRRVAYPLELITARRLTGFRQVLIGNAAHNLHPVAGQGYNLGLRDVAALAETLVDRAPGTDPGDPALLEAYVRWRARDQYRVTAFTDGLIRLFGLDLPLAGLARGAGLALFDLTPPAKRMLARRTMGQVGRMSRLARGVPL